jgi:hypothetical protein
VVKRSQPQWAQRRAFPAAWYLCGPIADFAARMLRLRAVLILVINRMNNLLTVEWRSHNEKLSHGLGTQTHE